MPPERAFNETADDSSAGSSTEAGSMAQRFEDLGQPKADHVRTYRTGPLYLDAVMEYARNYPEQPELYAWTDELIRERRMGIIIGVALACSIDGDNWDYQLDATFMSSLYEDVDQARTFLEHVAETVESTDG